MSRPLGILAGRLRQLVDVLAEKLSFGSPTTLVIVAGVVTVSKSFHKIDSLMSGTTNLTTILGGSQSNILVLMAANDSRTISLRDGDGNLQLAGNFNLDSIKDTITLIYDGSNWVELCRSNN